MPRFAHPYAALNDFVAPAGTRAEVWRIVTALIVALVLGFLGLQVLVIGLIANLGADGGAHAALDLARGATPAGVVALLFSYVAVMAGLAISLRLFMRRGLRSLMGPAWGDFWRVALPLTGLWVLLMPLSWSDEAVQANLAIGPWLGWLPFALVGLAVQTGTEELIFRGYLQQHLAARFRSRWVWMVIPSLLFGLSHYSPGQYGALAWVVVLWTGVFGLAAADLTARTGNLGAAVALHFANNIAAVLLIGMEGNLDGLALYTVPVDITALPPGVLYLVGDGLTLLIGWLVARLILRV
jgi:membrane protease YdiL (CAAX protease family)